MIPVPADLALPPNSPFTRSLRVRLLVLWVLIVATALSMTGILFMLYQQSANVRVEAGREAVSRACAQLSLLYRANAPQARTASGYDVDLLHALLNDILADALGVEGGVWDAQSGFVAYAFPTHDGAVPKRDVPEAERPWIAQQAQRVLETGATAVAAREGRRDALVVEACPLAAGTDAPVGWMMARVATASAQGSLRLAVGLGLLLAFVIVSGGWLLFAMQQWSHRVTRLVQALAHPVDRLPPLEKTGEPELDRIVEALNGFARRLAQADRLASLGRVAAGIAHEIRNPIAALRLRAENALSQPPGRQQEALRVVLDQAGRLELLCESLLSMAQPLRLDVRPTALAEWLAEHLRPFREQTAAAGIALESVADEGAFPFDAVKLGSVLDNLMRNALQHTPAGGRVQVSMTVQDRRLRLAVADNGRGVADGIRENLFEPFATTRPEGTGLGLALAREIVEAHGGAIRAPAAAQGGLFEVEIPWPAS